MLVISNFNFNSLVQFLYFILCTFEFPEVIIASTYLNADNYLQDISSCLPKISCNSSSKYSLFNGLCNNIENPYWGAMNYSYLRLQPPHYSNEFSSYRLGSDNKPLPLPRTLTETLFPDIGTSPSPSKTLNGAFVFFAQIISHDMISTPFSPAIGCCDNGRMPVEPKPNDCYPMSVSSKDPFYSNFNVSCMTYSHVFTTYNFTMCPTKLRQPASSVTSYIDLSMVYAPNEFGESSVRSYSGGKLNFTYNPNGSISVPFTHTANPFCRIQFPNESCLTGDDRLNQNPGVVAVTYLLTYEHNRIADELLKINPNWDDETTFQEARRISIAQFQHITYKELLPLVLDDSVRRGLKLDPLNVGYTKYDPSLNTGVFNSFVGAVWRSMHTMLPRDLFSLKQKSKGCPLSNNPKGRIPWFRSGDLGVACYKEMSAYQVKKTCNRYGPHTADQFRNYFQPADRKYGDDLHATDIWRGRDHGIAPYNNYRKICGFKPFSSFAEFAKASSNPQAVQKASKLYSSIDDVDLYVGVILERPNTPGMMGPTAQCIFSQQFARTKYGDRFFYEHGNQSGTFTEAQLKSIKKTSYSALLCNNINLVTKVQRRSFEYVSPRNPVVPCSKIDQIDLSLWKEK